MTAGWWRSWLTNGRVQSQEEIATEKSKENLTSTTQRPHLTPCFQCLGLPSMDVFPLKGWGFTGFCFCFAVYLFISFGVRVFLCSTLNSRSFCLGLLSTRVKGMTLHTALSLYGRWSLPRDQTQSMVAPIPHSSFSY